MIYRVRIGTGTMMTFVISFSPRRRYQPRIFEYGAFFFRLFVCLKIITKYQFNSKLNSSGSPGEQTKTKAV